MKDEAVQELLASVREGGAILRGEKKPARAFEVPEPDVAELRGRLGLSQSKFAALIGISVRTLQEWEQGRRHPRGPARVLLRIASVNPKAIVEAVHPDAARRLEDRATGRRAAAAG